MSDAPEHDHAPPSGRFAKGRSGNPKGRPRKQPSPGVTSAFDIVIYKRLTITQGGVERELTLDEALQSRTYQDALAGNRTARREVLKMIAKREKAIAAKGKQVPQGATIKIEPTDPRNIDEALCLLGIAAPDETRRDYHLANTPLLLEPWAVQAAFSRRRGSAALTPREVLEIERCTRAHQTLHWPRKATE